MKKGFWIIVSIGCLMLLLSLPVFAVTEDEVQRQVDSVGKSGVTGNLFIWFLCSIAFLKISQKIDTFMSSLGIHVGNTGGSMLTEALIAVRGVSLGKNFLGGNRQGFSGKSSGSGTRFAQGGLAGMMSRGLSRSAVKHATGEKAGGLGGMAYHSSLMKGGGFANQVIGQIANGKNGSITGNGAQDALMSYMGITALGDAADLPSYSDVEMGGGIITATEMNAENPDGIEMRMVSAQQY